MSKQETIKIGTEQTPKISCGAPISGFLPLTVMNGKLKYWEMSSEKVKSYIFEFKPSFCQRQAR